MSSRTRLPERESEGEFTWEDPFSRGGGSRRGPSKRSPRRVALPVVGVALVAGLIIGYMVSGGGSTTTVTETKTVTAASAPATPTASGPDTRPDISVAVLNGSGEAGLAAQTGELLRGMGYTKITEGNAPSLVAADRVLYRPGAEAQAMRVAQDLNAGAPVPLADDSGAASAAPTDDVVVIMGPSSASKAGQGTATDATGDAGAAGATGTQAPATATPSGDAGAAAGDTGDTGDTGAATPVDETAGVDAAATADAAATLR